MAARHTAAGNPVTGLATSMDDFIRDYYRQLKRHGIECKDKEITTNAIHKQIYSDNSRETFRAVNEILNLLNN